jgi:histidyl-tRNA synthetase
MPKPSIPQGTRDFGPEVVRKRTFLLRQIQTAFEQCGFMALETPAMENLDTLLGKYGDEGDKLIFKILNNGLDRPEKKDQALADFQQVLAGKNEPGITERALRYDLTIPFARYVAMNHGQLNFPFKRYQIQPVWRADRPQKGRYREFYQCDADIVGTNSLLAEMELAGLYATVFKHLKLPVEIRINHRKILAALAEACDAQERLTDLTVAIDKLEKIGLDKVKEELQAKGFSEKQLDKIRTYLHLSEAGQQSLGELDKLIGHSPNGRQGMQDLEQILGALPANDPFAKAVPDFTLARGLNYYTGSIFEVKAMGTAMGSIGGGGRYDDLTGLFGVPNLPGVGISFGVDRIYDVMETLNLFPEFRPSSSSAVFLNLGNTPGMHSFGLMQQLRARGVACEMYFDSAKLDKQFRYAEKKGIPYAIIIGEEEMKQRVCLVKDLRKGQQISLNQSVFAADWMPE